MELSKDIKGRILIELLEKTGSVDTYSLRIAERGYSDYIIGYLDEYYKDKYLDQGVAYATGQRVGRMYDYAG